MAQNSNNNNNNNNNTLKDVLETFDLTFSFSAGGWFQMYHFGAAQAIVDSGILSKMEASGKRVRFAGSSAGCLVSVCLASKKYCFKEIRDTVLKYGEHYRSSIFNLFCMRQYLSEALEEFGSHMKNLEMKPKLCETLNDGSLEIFITTLPYMRRKVVNHFFSFDDIAEAIMASCCMAPLVGVPFRLRETGEWVCDGCLATITPHNGEPRTISVSPFYCSSATVHPTIFVPVWWGLRPPDRVAHRNLFSLGYNDMIEGLVANSYLTPKEGEKLLKPEIEYIFKGNFLMHFCAYFLDILIIIFIRPVVVSFIYIELAIMGFVYFIRGLICLDRKPFGKLYNNLRNLISVRTLGRLIFGDKVPHNRQRLEKSSRLYRVFKPIALGGKKSTERAVMSPTGEFSGRMPSLSAATLNQVDASTKPKSKKSRT